MPRRRLFRAAEAAAAVLLLVVGTACGSRLPESDFGHGERTAPGQDGAPIRVGIITSVTSPVGGNAFTGPRDGAKAYFERLNARGGVDGHRVEVRECDDGGSGVGNNACVHRLIDEDKVVALVATTALDYAGASRVSRARVPDIGGQPIGSAYDTWPHLYGVYGSLAPREGTTGWGGNQYGGTEVYRYFKREHGARTAAVVSYNQAASAAYARLVEQGLKAEGYEVVTEQVDFALPNFRAVAADLREQGVDLVFDAVDSHGNAKLCEAMDRACCPGHRQGHQRAELDVHRPGRLQGRPALPQRPVGDRVQPELRGHRQRGRTGVQGRHEGPEDALPVAVGGLGGRDVVHGRGEVLRGTGHHARVRRRFREPQPGLHRGRSPRPRHLRTPGRSAACPAGPVCRWPAGRTAGAGSPRATWTAPASTSRSCPTGSESRARAEAVNRRTP